MTLSTKDRLEARVHIGQIISFKRLLKIMKSLGHAMYIYSDLGGIQVDYINPDIYRYVKIVEIFERENQIWMMGEMIMATVVKIEGVR